MTSVLSHVLVIVHPVCFLAFGSGSRSGSWTKRRVGKASVCPTTASMRLTSLTGDDRPSGRVTSSWSARRHRSAHDVITLSQRAGDSHQSASLGSGVLAAQHASGAVSTERQLRADARTRPDRRTLSLPLSVAVAFGVAGPLDFRRFAGSGRTAHITASHGHITAYLIGDSRTAGQHSTIAGLMKMASMHIA